MDDLRFHMWCPRCDCHWSAVAESTDLDQRSVSLHSADAKCPYCGYELSAGDDVILNGTAYRLPVVRNSLYQPPANHQPA